ncbi:MAG: hypothetical protein JSR66_28160 [Proteobacteria bacterium]|nr:hypothetical protein [Pseudomonadota bacterium]
MASVVSHAQAAPSLKILYHEGIRPQVKQVAGHTRSMSFEAYGRQFNFQLQPNPALLNAVPADRADIEPLRGVLQGLLGSWVRMTHTRTGWHGMISDGAGELYAVEPAADVTDSVVQPLADATASVIYRLKDALLPDGAAYCQILNADNTPFAGENLPVSAKTMVDAMVKETTRSGSFPNGPDLELTVGVVADYEFYQKEIADPEGAIIARWDIVDGIWSGQVGVKIKLAPLTILTSAHEPFTATNPNSLLQQLRSYRGANAAQMETGLSHLMTGRDLDGGVVGIAYISSVCNGDAADSLSEGAHSALESALIAAHELGHNFNAPHDGEAGACQSTPQSYLMAPQINYSDQFSSCSITQITARIQTASCLMPYEAPDVRVELPATAIGATANTAFTVSFVAHAIGDDASNSVTASATIPAGITVQAATAAGGSCTTDVGNSTVSCTLGNMAAQDTRQIDLTLVGSTVGTSTANVSVASPNDYVSSNNSAQVSIQISAAAPSTSASTGGTANATGASSGGGGGGAIDLSILAMLAGSAGFAAWRRHR